ncbi:4Fe-4S ferredoxin [Candidatus Bathyarchaeota archaeon]|nr:MAG: 4Fe-4S ferredoxin [Candidatus Bathyarchaeota archaeon]
MVRLQKAQVAYVDPSKCLRCFKCPPIEVCPSKAISRLDPDEPPFVDVEYCLGCGECAKKCPAAAISVKI